MSTANVNALAPAPIIMWWDGGERAITAREKARIEEHGPSCFSIALVPATPSARWAADGLPDPHAGRYACERAALTLGNLTDDELANAVYLHGNEQPSMADLVAGKALSGIVYLTAAKDRIRWLSRALEATCKQPLQVGEVQGDELAALESAMPYLETLHSIVGGEARASVWRCIERGRLALAARQPGVQEPVIVEAVGTIKLDDDQEPYIDWLVEGGIHALPVGDVLIAASGATITNDEGYGEVYAAPPAQGTDLGQQQDAERYRWLRDHYDPSVHDDEDGSFLRLAGEELDAAIDGQRDAAPGAGSRTDHLLDRRNRLMNSYGNGDREDAALDEQIAKIDAELAGSQRDVATGVGNG